MKKINLKDKSQMLIVIFGISLIFIALGITLISVFSTKDKTSLNKEPPLEQTSVFVNDPYRNAKKITSRKLSKKHCLGDICVKDLTIYYTKECNNIEFNLINKGNNPATGYLKVVFGDKAMTVSYKSLKKKEISPYTIQLGDDKISDTSDFTLRKLTSEELARIKK